MTTTRSCLPIELRIRLYHEVHRLREEGLSYNEIVEAIHTNQGVRITASHVSYWIRGIYNPLGNVTVFTPNPSPPFAYIIGVLLGDGWLYRNGRKYLFGLCVADYDFAAETGRQLAKLLERNEPYLPRWDNWNLRWYLHCRSILLCQALYRPWQELKPYIEHCKDCVAAFLRGFYDSEGSIDRRSLKVYNTDLELLGYVQRLLQHDFEVKATGPHICKKPGRISYDRRGKIYRNKKTVFYLYTCAASLPRFHRHIGFTIKRKQHKLTEATRDHQK